MGQATEGMVQQLKANSPTLVELNKAFRRVIEGIDLLTCYEQRPTKTIIKVCWAELSDVSQVDLAIGRRWRMETRWPFCDNGGAKLGTAGLRNGEVFPC